MKNKRHITDISTTWTLSGLALAACGGGGGASGGLGGSAVSVTFDGDYIAGTPSADTLIGTSQRDLIIDDAGSNTVLGNGGNDYIIASGNVDGGDGNDFIFHNNVGGNNQVSGGDGNDVITTELGVISGGNGNDFIRIIADDGERANFLGSQVRRASADNEVIDKDELFQFTPFTEVGNGITNANGGSGNDIIFVESDPGDGRQHDLRGGAGDDQIITTHDAVITSGTGHDEFGIPIIFDDDYSTNLNITIIDFERGSDKIVFIFDPEELSLTPDSLSDLQSLDILYSIIMIDADNDGIENDNQIKFSLRSQITNKEVSYNLLIKNTNELLTEADVDFITIKNAVDELSEIQQDYIDTF